MTRAEKGHRRLRRGRISIRNLMSNFQLKNEKLRRRARQILTDADTWHSPP